MNSTEDSALLLALLDAAVDAIIIADREGAILRLNAAAAQLFGHPVEGLKGRNVRVLMPDAMATRHDGFMQRHLDTGERRIIGIGRDVEGLRADGTVFPLHLSVGRADIGGDVIFVGILHDQTRRKAAEDAAARSQRMDAIGQMAGGIAHDFNNLLTVIMGNLELLDMAETAAKSRALITDALAAAELGADLTARLTAFSRKSALKSDVENLNAVVEQSLAMLRRTIATSIAITTRLDPQAWPVRLDASQLQTAILNLALNAQDAMPTGGAIAVETCNATLDDAYIAQEIGVPPGNYVRVTVSDTGTGMAPAVRDRALEPFFTTKPVGKGTGLGLSMVYGFVKQSGGHVTIYSETGAGTTISLYFPAVADAAATDASGDAAGPVPTLGTAHLVLVVDDDLRVLRSSAARLAALGFTCISATTADEAWAILQGRGDISLVFTDLVMPGTMSGHDLAHRIRREKPGVKVLMTSGFSDSVLSDAGSGDPIAILRKPYRQADLVQALVAVLAAP